MRRPRNRSQRRVGGLSGRSGISLGAGEDESRCRKMILDKKLGWSVFGFLVSGLQVLSSRAAHRRTGTQFCYLARAVQRLRRSCPSSSTTMTKLPRLQSNGLVMARPRDKSGQAFGKNITDALAQGQIVRHLGGGPAPAGTRRAAARGIRSECARVAITSQRRASCPSHGQIGSPGRVFRRRAQGVVSPGGTL